jgi:hypothetical protein
MASYWPSDLLPGAVMNIVLDEQFNRVRDIPPGKALLLGVTSADPRSKPPHGLWRFCENHLDTIQNKSIGHYG